MIALASKWVLDGGVRRRDRHVIREELELADMLGDRPEAQQLRESAERRLERYLRPPLTKRAASTIRSGLALAIALVLGIIPLQMTIDESTTLVDKVVLGLGVGFFVGLYAVLIQWMIDSFLRIRARRARRAAQLRRD